MDIAVLSDIHSNYIALQQCIQYVLKRKINTFVFLGDYLGELPYPRKTLEILYWLSSHYKCYFIKGNKEDYWLNFRKNGEKGWKDKDSTTGALFYTYHQLKEKDINFFQEMSFTRKIVIEKMPQVTVCHGSPNRVNEKLLPSNKDTFNIIDQSEDSIILCGHTHVQSKIEHNGKVVLNPGSVGVSLHASGKAQFMILRQQKNDWLEEFVSVVYDVEKIIGELYESGLCEAAPYWCRVTENLLRTGETSHGSVLARAMKYCEQDKGFCNWPNIPEKYWKQAVDEMIG